MMAALVVGLRVALRALVAACVVAMFICLLSGDYWFAVMHAVNALLLKRLVHAVDNERS